MSDKIWLLLSKSQENQTPHKALEEVYWDAPSIYDIKLYFGLSPSNDYLDPKFQQMLNGSKTLLYGTEYWVEEFVNKNKTKENEKSNITVVRSRDYLFP